MRYLIYDVIAAIDIERFTSDEAGCIVRQECSGGADIIDTHEAACWSLAFCPIEEGVKLRDAGSGAGCKWSWRNGMYANSLRAKLGSHVSDCTFKRCFGETHDVIVFHHHLAAELGPKGI